MSIPSARWIPLLALPLSACVVVLDGDGAHSFWEHSVRGSGVRAEADRQVPEFHAIQLETSATVLVKVGEAPSLHLSGDDNLLPEVQTEVRNGVLIVDLHRSGTFRCGLELVIGTPSLERFDIEGSGEVKIQGLADERVELAIEGSGTIRAQGTAQKLIGSIEGSGSLSLVELAAVDADLSIEGSGSMDVHVAKALHYSIEGSGSIHYAGGPQLAGQIDGSGSIEKDR